MAYRPCEAACYFEIQTAFQHVLYSHEDMSSIVKSHVSFHALHNLTACKQTSRRHSFCVWLYGDRKSEFGHEDQDC